MCCLNIEIKLLLHIASRCCALRYIALQCDNKGTTLVFFFLLFPLFRLAAGLAYRRDAIAAYNYEYIYMHAVFYMQVVEVYIRRHHRSRCVSVIIDVS